MCVVPSAVAFSAMTTDWSTSWRTAAMEACSTTSCSHELKVRAASRRASGTASGSVTVSNPLTARRGIGTPSFSEIKEKPLVKARWYWPMGRAGRSSPSHRRPSAVRRPSGSIGRAKPASRCCRGIRPSSRASSGTRPGAQSPAPPIQSTVPPWPASRRASATVCAAVSVAAP